MLNIILLGESQDSRILAFSCQEGSSLTSDSSFELSVLPLARLHARCGRDVRVPVSKRILQSTYLLRPIT